MRSLSSHASDFRWGDTKFFENGMLFIYDSPNGIGASSISKTPKTSSIAILRNIPVVTGHVLSAPFSLQARVSSLWSDSCSHRNFRNVIRNYFREEISILTCFHVTKVLF